MSSSKFKPGKHLPVAFDIDGIFLDTATEMWKGITKHLGLDWGIERWTHYEIGKIVGIPTRELRHVYEPILDNYKMPPVEGAPEALNELYDVYQKPILFITARRKPFKKAAIESIRAVLNPSVEFEVLCTGDIYADEARNDKFDLLKEYQVKVFVEDNYLHWEQYIDAGIKIATLKWPWTVKPYLDLRDRGKRMQLFSDWENMHQYLNKWLSYHLWVKKSWAEVAALTGQPMQAVTNFLSNLDFVCDHCGHEFAKGQENFSFKSEAGSSADSAIVSVKCPQCGEY